MMRQSVKHLTFAASSLFMLACSTDMYNEPSAPATDGSNGVVATQELLADGGNVFESGATTRTAMTSDKKVAWKVGDNICFYNGRTNYKYTVKAVHDDDAASCTFASQSGPVAQADTYYAVYPYNGGYGYSNGMITGVTLPANQNATDGSFDPECNLMVAKANDLSQGLQFKHVCSYIKVTPSVDCSRIVLSFNTNVAGTFDVAMDENGIPSVTNISDGSMTINLIGDIKAGKEYYVAVLGNITSSQFKATLEKKPMRDDITTWEHEKKVITLKSYYKEATKELKADRAKILSIGDVADGTKVEKPVEFEWLEYGDNPHDDNVKSGTAVLWAKYNLGAESKDGLGGDETAAGDYYAWGEVEPRDNAYTWANYLCKDYYPDELDYAHDAAAVHNGLGWKIPTADQFTTMKQSTIWVYNGTMQGYYVYPAIKDENGNVIAEDYQLLPKDGQIYRVETGLDGKKELLTNAEVKQKIYDLSPNKNIHIFIKMAGYKGETENTANPADVVQYGNKAAYWTNGRAELESKVDPMPTAYYLGMDQERFNMRSYYKPRYYGFTIRPCITISWGDSSAKQ